VRPGGDEPDREARVRRDILRRASLYSYGMLALTLAVAVGGSALIAWALSLGGLPFLGTWIGLAVIVLAPPLVRVAVNALRARKHD
jgi:hypothetical protein